MAASHKRVRVAPNLYQRGDGRYVAGLTVDGRWTMKTLGARTKREAKLELARLQADAARTGLRAVEPELELVIAVAQVTEEFLRRFEAQVGSGERSPRTLDHYAWTLRSYLVPAWGGRDVRSVSPDDVVSLSQRLREDGRGPSVLKAVEETASRLFSFALRRGYVESNPVAKLERGERARVTNDDTRVLTHDEIRRLLDAAEGSFEVALLGVLLYAGLRQGEVLGLRWREIDSEHGLIRLQQQLQRPRGGRPSMLAPLKMHSTREVVLVPQLGSRLRELRLASINSQDEDFVFADLNGSPVHYSRMNRMLKRLAATAGVERVTSHVFRRTFASHLIIEQGLDAVRVQRQLGHSRASVTLDRYAFLFEQARHANELRESIGASPYGALLGTSEASGVTV
jgi:integrase